MARYWSGDYGNTEQVGSTVEVGVTMIDRIRWDKKQDALVFDDHPVLGSSSPVTSDGVARAILQVQDFVKQKDVELCYIDVVVQDDTQVLRDKTYIDIHEAYKNGKTLVLRFTDDADKCAYFYDFQGNVFRFVMFEVTDVLNMYTYWISPDDLLHTEVYSAPYKRPNPETFAITYGEDSVIYDGSEHASINIPKVYSWALNDTKPKYTASEVGAEEKGVAGNKVSSHDSDAYAHADIRNEIKNVAATFNAYATNEQLSSVLQAMQSYALTVQSLQYDAVLHSEVVDDTSTNNPSVPLSARQGMFLKSYIDNNRKELEERIDDIAANGVPVNDGYTLLYIKWNGDITDKETIAIQNTTFYKVSNLTYTVDELDGSNVEINGFGEDTITWAVDKSLFEETDDMIILKANGGSAIVTFGVVVKHDIESSTKGIYFMDGTTGNTRIFTEKLSELTFNSGGVSSWNDLTDKPFYDESTMLFEWDGDTEGLDSVDYGTVSPELAGMIMYKVSDTPLTYDELLGSMGIGIMGGQVIPLEITEEQLMVNGNIISIGGLIISVLEDTEQDGLMFTRGLWHLPPIDIGGYVTEINKSDVKQLDSKFVDAYTKEQIDTMFGNYVTEVADLVGGEA